MDQGCPLGAAGALTSGPELSYGPCSDAAKLQAPHVAGPAPAQPQGGPSVRAGAALVPPLAAPHLTGAVEQALTARPCPDGPLEGPPAAVPWHGMCPPSNTQLTVAQHNCSSRFKFGYLSLLGFTVIALNIMPLK